ncbi:MAG: hypothetical protein R2760_07250 [Chitinophagales bacterium]
MPFYADLFLLTKDYKTYFVKDTVIVYDSVIDISGIKSDPYSFEYTINLGEYDSVYYFGEYPMPKQVQYTKTELYDDYKKFYNNIFYNINSYRAFMNKNYYVVYALYKNGKISFCKSKHTINNVRVLGDNFMLRNSQKTIVHGMNFKQKNGNIDSEVSFECVDGISK